MGQENRFCYSSLAEFGEDLERRGLELPLREDLSVLRQGLPLAGKTLPNRLAVHPMEGCDAQPDGSPGELTLRRYERFAAGGAGLIWFEAAAVVPEGRANPRQLWLNERSALAFEKTLARARKLAAQGGTNPLCLLQLTHSGRYSRPEDRRLPVIVDRYPQLDRHQGLDGRCTPASDDYLDRLQEAFVRAARLAQQVGFDGVDIKACHRYLVNELLAARSRAGKYGGTFQNRTRFLREVVGAVKSQAAGDFLLATRLNLYDGMDYPWGWGVADSPPATGRLPAPDLAEPLRLIGLLAELGLSCVSVTAGNPYFNPFINRPADRAGNNQPPEHPLCSVVRLADMTRQVQQAFPKLCVLGAGLTWLRQFFPQAAAGLVADGWASLAGLGRQAFAYPDFARDTLSGGGFDPARVCLTCGACSQIMRDGGMAGCPIRDAEVYKPIYEAGRKAAAQRNIQ
jgi:2,4-dienoyl-CoA reductase-like NADH-dependent reductase (Old Yellow Enzyme family)